MEQLQQKSEILLKDVLLVKIVNDIDGHPGHTSRVHLTSGIFGLNIVADINKMIFPVHIGEKLIWMLSRSSLDNGHHPLNGKFNFQHVVYGKVDSINELPTDLDGKRMQEIRISYGGLHHCIQGEADLFQDFKLNMGVYFQLKRQIRCH